MIKPFRSIVAACAVFSLSANIVAPSTCLSAPAQQVNINGDDNNVVDGNLTINNGVGKPELRSVRKEIQELKQIALQQNLQAAQSKPAFQKIVQNIYHKPYAALTEREHITFWENVLAALERAEKAEREFENVRQGTVNAQLKALFPKIEAARNDFNYDEVNRLLSEFRNNHKDLRQDLAKVDFLQGQNYELQINYAEAERYYKRAAVNDDENTLYLNDYAGILQTLGRYAEAETIIRHALAIDEKAVGPKNPIVATRLNNLAVLLEAQGKYVEAEPLYRRALAINEKALGSEHPNVAAGLNNLAGLLRAQGKYVEAEPLYRRALAIGEKTLGTDHPAVATRLNNLAGLLQAQGKYVEAEPLYRRALAIGEKRLGPDHPAVATRLNNLAGLVNTQGKYVEAEPLYRRALAIGERTLGTEHPNTIIIRDNLNALLEKSKH